MFHSASLPLICTLIGHPQISTTRVKKAINPDHSKVFATSNAEHATVAAADLPLKTGESLKKLLMATI